ncbi:CpaD family pilus assembly protein [Terrihabitans sp. B22-R8]|uniref:CpaD family pilus assembly protein n=1 Tax=Terrihabitans sp. B22-R8 TaxID=3425128 RepID=UPI00403C6B5D
MRAVLSCPLRGLALAALVLTLAACNDRGDITSGLPDTPAGRHPIQVTRGQATLDLLPGGGPGGLTDRQIADVRAFAAGWTANGRGQLTVETPFGAGPVTDTQSAAATKEIRRQVLAAGVPSRAVLLARYPANGPDHLAPVRLSYPVLEARVPHSCDVSVEDAGYSDPEMSNRNRGHWNFGCAQQTNIAAMVDDPEDFIRPRADDRADAERRSVVIERYRGGAATIGATTSQSVNTDQ